MDISLPQSLGPLIIVHSDQVACGTTVEKIFGDEGGRLADYTAFEQGCLDNADPLFFLEAIMNAGGLSQRYLNCTKKPL